jgi:hypothetical protein
MNYEPLHAFAEKHRVSYNELCAAVREAIAIRAALAAPEPQCSPTLTECPKCKNDIKKCPMLAAPAPAVLPVALTDEQIDAICKIARDVLAAHTKGTP